jgi:hypothetical protein
LKGTIVLDKENLVIHTRRKGKDWVMEYKILTISPMVQQRNTTRIDFTFSSIATPDSEASLRMHDDGTWTLEYKKAEKKMYYTGITFKQELYNRRK